MSFPHHTSRDLHIDPSSSHEEGDDPLTSKALPPPPPDAEDPTTSLRASRLSLPSFHHSHSAGSLYGMMPDARRSSESVGRGSGSAYPQRSSSHGVVASHFLAQPPDPQLGQTWMDFLRDNDNEGQHNDGSNIHGQWAPAFPASSSSSRYPPQLPRTNSNSSVNSVERKRRLTAPESPGRQPSGRRTRPSYGSIHNVASPEPMVMDHTPSAPPPPRPPYHSHPSRPSIGREGRRQSNISDIALPPWQPDNEVSDCPVCGTQFTFWYRKHHCRKCGRVVCAACSPHRITIPRQFIVHSPSEVITGANMIDLSGSDDDNQMSAFGPFRNPALGGGEVVRVCNPCVPDPNYSPPPQPPPYASRPAPETYASRGSDARHSFPRGHRPSHSESHTSRDVFNREGVVYQGRTRVSDLFPPTVAPPFTTLRPHPSTHHPPSHRHSAALGFLQSAPQDPRMHTSASAPPQQEQPPPRRQIAEEDECPVCGDELPLRGPDGDETAREEHIQSCIVTFSAPPTSTPPTHTSTPAPPSQATASVPNPTTLSSTSLPATRTRGMSDLGGTSSSNQSPAGGAGPSMPRTNRMSISARGLYPYTATEKDCFDQEGQEQEECIICFEEFEPGDRMARLVCWCKFHEDCIRSWWDKKGRGACPTHQLHE